MRRKIVLLTIIVTLLFMGGCGPKIHYSEEFDYLPIYPNSELQDLIIPDETTENDEGFSVAVYIVRRAKQEEVINDYEIILQGEGWSTTYNGKPETISVAKDNHQAHITVYQIGEDVQIAITSK